MPPAPDYRGRRLLESQWTALALIVATVAAVLGPALRPGERVWPWNDVMFTALSLDHLQGVLLSAGDWTRGPVAWPLDGSVSQVDWLLGPAVLGIPLRLAGVDPLDTYAWVVAAGLVLSALAWHAVARALLGPGPHTWLAALAGGLHPLALAHAPYVNLAHGEAAALAPLLLGAGLVRRRAGLAVAGGLLAGASAHLGFYQGAHAGLGTAAVLACATAARLGNRRSWTAAAAGLLIGVLTVVPVARVYGQTAQIQDVRPDKAALVGESWDPARGLALRVGGVPSSFHPGHIPIDDATPDTTPLEGPWVLALAGIGLVLAGRQRGTRWAWAAVVVGSVSAAALALGPEIHWSGRPTTLPSPGRLLLWVPGVENLRAPARWLMVTLGGVALLAALGAQKVVGRVARRWPAAAWLAVVFPAVWLAGGLSVSVTEPRALVEPSPHYALIDQVQRPGALVELTGRGRGGCMCTQANRFRAAMHHHRPLVGGLYSRRLQSLVNLDRASATWPNADAVELFRRIGVAAVFEHSAGPAPDPEVALCTTDGTHRLCELIDPPWPMPPVDAVVPTSGPPVDGLAWTSEPVPLSRVEFSCDGRSFALQARPWQVLTMLRRGPNGPKLEVLLPERCHAVPEAVRGQPELRRIESDRDDWLPTR